MADKYLKIENKGSLHRDFLKSIGLSIKRDHVDDPGVIGKNGSGTKLSAPASLRLGLGIVVTSTDENGPYQMSHEFDEYEVEGAKAFPTFYRFRRPSPLGGEDQDAGRERSGMDREGFPDWDKPIGADGNPAFKVIREFICNARDEDAGFIIELVAAPTYVPEGRTAVFIRLTKDVIRILVRTNIDRYFKFLAPKCKPVARVTDTQGDLIGEIYPKSQKDVSRLFMLGVLIDCSNEWYRVSSPFDYSLAKKSLISEERVITSIDAYCKELGRMFAGLTDRKVIKSVVNAMKEKTCWIEEIALATMTAMTAAQKAAWLDVVCEVHGQKLVIASENWTLNRDAHHILGYTIVGEKNDHHRQFFKNVGIPRADDIAPKVEVANFTALALSDIALKSREDLLTAFQILAKYLPESALFPIRLLYPKDERLWKWLTGAALIDNAMRKEIWVVVNKDRTLPELKKLLGTLCHEARHCLTGADDYDRKFINHADVELVSVMLAAECLPKRRELWKTAGDQAAKISIIEPMPAPVLAPPLGVIPKPVVWSDLVSEDEPTNPDGEAIEGENVESHLAAIFGDGKKKS